MPTDSETTVLMRRAGREPVEVGAGEIPARMAEGYRQAAADEAPAGRAAEEDGEVADGGPPGGEDE